MGTIAVWFRKDLRFHDQTALAKAILALHEEDQIIGLFHLHPALNQTFSPRHDYFYATLKSFVDDGKELNFPIHFMHGNIFSALDDLLIKTSDLEALYFNYDEVGFGRERDDAVIQHLNSKDIAVFPCLDHHIHSAHDILKADHSHYKVFSSYYKRWSKAEKPKIVQVDIDKLKKHAVHLQRKFADGEQVYQELLSKRITQWEHVGEQQALQRIEEFTTETIDDYHRKRDYPALQATSGISAYLRTGQLSPRTIFYAALDKIQGRADCEGIETFIKELAWRDFYNMIYHYYPKSKNEELIEKYRGLTWNTDDADLFKRWTEGQTGFPIVDAGMRQLNQTGWMHNRVRMIVASFLTKDLLIDWRKGERYFEERLIDYDPASNIGGWQWAASTGTDAVPYFRIFNPTRQSERFDPNGIYIKQYIPELKNVPVKYIHNPITMPDSVQKESSCIIGKDYPKPIVDHRVMREKALELFKESTSNGDA
ncbi:cryptochrome/photolyase family protein [Bacillus horti]|uniref:Deoxyribodipyrimidine photo-lyase n=1 Tax=Caldalkalibacillus horti TaxID=77523 RepID=A0ABT9W5G7_9BACI|nr:deoxyribodipyrimidine photo-lyase [Bacillus horti]MDQ0168488.1 deoxyribodipyrimidine photo-lyase [Bacillus horti]